MRNESGGGRGGWRYGANYSDSDNSVAQWPVLGLIAAEQWGIYAPDWVKSELNYWVNYVQNANGCSGYSYWGNAVNIAKLIISFFMKLPPWFWGVEKQVLS